MSKDKVSVLSKHDTICEFLGIDSQPCHFKTALCPDRCDHGAATAKFKVIEYKKYEEVGQYGDEKQELIFVEVKKPVYQQDPKIAETCKSLKKGQKVRLLYDHLYVDDGFDARPERPVISLAVI